VSNTEKIYYFVVNYTKETLEELRDRGYEESITHWFSGGSTKFEDSESLMSYIEEETKLVEAGTAIAAIKK